MLFFAVEIYGKSCIVFILLYFILANMVVKVPNEDKVIIPCKELIVSSHLCFDIGKSAEVFN